MFCRARKDDRAGCCLKFPTDSDIVTIDNNQQKKMFSFDKVYDPNSTQEQVCGIVGLDKVYGIVGLNKVCWIVGMEIL